MPKILIVDDEWLTRLEIEEMLTDLGYEVAGQAETGTEAVAMARELNPDLILMDVEMPGEMNGLDAAREIKAELGTPIVFISGHDDPEYIEAAKEIAPFGYVMKPFDEREVHAFVEIALTRRELELKLEEAHDELERRVEARTSELASANKQLQKENEMRKRTEDALRESEEHLRSFMESAKGFIVYRLEVDPENYFSGRLIFVSPGIEDEIGISPEAEFSEWFNSAHPDDLPSLIEAQAKSVQNGDTFDREFRWKNLKGGWEWCHAISNPVFDSEGKPKYYNGMIINVTAQKQAEMALQESEEKFRLIAENSIDAIWQTDLNNKVTYISPSSIHIGGYTPEEVMKFENALELYDDELRTLITTEMSKLLQKPVEELKRYTIPRIEGRALHKDGHKIWVEIQVKFIFKENMIVGVQGISRDISERKEAEEALRESEKKLNAILDATTETIVLLDRNGIVHVANQIVCDRLGTTKEEFVGKRIYDFFPPDVAEVRKEKWEKVFATGKPVSFEDSRKNMAFEQRAYPVLDKEGQVQMVVAFANDKTDRRLAKEALRESEEKFRLISEQSLLAIGILQDGHMIYANETYSKITGYSLEEIYGWEPYGYARTVYKDDLPLVMKQSRKKQAGDEDVITNYQFRGFTKTKEIVWWDLYSRTITYHGRPADLFTFIDITERVKSEKEREALQAKLQHSQKMEAIGTLAGGVAHDLNNILGGLVSYPELLLLKLPEDSPLRKSILTMQRSGEKAAAVVQDLLTLARRGVVVTEVVNLNDAIAEHLKSPEYEKLQSYHPAVHLEAHLEKDVLNILGSSTHLSKTVMNLVSNAAEAMPEGGALTVSTENRYIDRSISGYDDVKEGDYVVLTVSDTGTGIAPEDMEKIFEPFYTKKKMGRSGTGLGMAVVWGTVKDHNGYIDVQSTEGKGTTFTLYFPVTRKSVEERSEISLKNYMGKGEAILVVDDVEEQRKIASGMLKGLGYSVVSFSSGEEAIEYLTTNEVHLILLDMIMDPGLDGLDTYRKILEIHPGQKAIIASGFSETDRVKAVQDLGAGVYIRKPFLLEKIGIAVKKELEKSEARSL